MIIDLQLEVNVHVLNQQNKERLQSGLIYLDFYVLYNRNLSMVAD